MAPGGSLGANHCRSFVPYSAGGADRLRQYAPDKHDIANCYCVAQNHLAKFVVRPRPEFSHLRGRGSRVGNSRIPAQAARSTDPSSATQLHAHTESGHFSFDHLVGASEHGHRNVEAERLGGLEINHQLVLVRGLDGQIGRFLTF